jgi:hypothetical protein
MIKSDVAGAICKGLLVIVLVVLDIVVLVVVEIVVVV